LVFPVERLIKKTSAMARAALEQLLQGTTGAERTQGYFSSINEGVKINSLTIDNGTAKVDFDSQMNFQMGGSCRVTDIRAEITETLKQFPTIKDVIISVNGNVDEALQP
jgi:spore germination protein GerM